ncbi:hypothetical protein [Dongia sp.]|uniref:hypothetical protein n=1 Tax=Dongia sp. TaxID=1977262 RepID=UPI0034A0EFF5
MIFAELPLTECDGAILAHSQRVGADMFRKGRVLTEADIAALRMAGLAHVTVAKLEADDVAENAAAQQLAEALAAGDPHLTLDPAFAGRVNIHAASAGVLALDVAAIDALNALDEAVTLATLPPFAAMVPGQMAATIKIIPYAVPRALLDRALARIRAASCPLLRLHPYRKRRIALIQTELPGLKSSVLEKTERVTGERLAAMGQAAPIATRCAHNSDALAAAIAGARAAQAEMILIIGASAISDRRDVIPAAITHEGGAVDHFGMPVDPGNLLLLAHIDGNTAASSSPSPSSPSSVSPAARARSSSMAATGCCSACWRGSRLAPPTSAPWASAVCWPKSRAARSRARRAPQHPPRRRSPPSCSQPAAPAAWEATSCCSISAASRSWPMFWTPSPRRALPRSSW